MTIADDMPQTIADELMPILPERWGCYSVEVVLRGGMAANPASTAVAIRAVVGPSPYRVREISGVSADLATAIVDLHNRAREIDP